MLASLQISPHVRFFAQCFFTIESMSFRDDAVIDRTTI